jgi:hypothetical protein
MVTLRARRLCPKARAMTFQSYRNTSPRSQGTKVPPPASLLSYTMGRIVRFHSRYGKFFPAPSPRSEPNQWGRMTRVTIDNCWHWRNLTPLTDFAAGVHCLQACHPVTRQFSFLRQAGVEWASGSDGMRRNAGAAWRTWPTTPDPLCPRRNSENSCSAMCCTGTQDRDTIRSLLV